ncbi:MAG: hypothetical protein AAF416_08020 [Pseudomonadota bacterium]
MSDTAAHDIDAHVYWSIYVRTSTHRKLKEVHLPQIERILDDPPYRWEIRIEAENPGLIRIETSQNLSAPTVDEIVTTLLRRASPMSRSWTLQGLEDLSRGELQRISGWSGSPQQNGGPPAVESVFFEALPGRISRPVPHGTWSDAGS